MTPPLIPLVRLSGSHREVGEQLGEAARGAIRRSLESGRPPEGRTLEQQLALAASYREATHQHLPWVVTELDAVADAAGVDRLHLFAASTEEIWSEQRSLDTAGRGCSDLVVGPPRTADRHVLVAHNNDLSAAEEDDVVALEWHVRGQPMLFTLGTGPWLSVGWNDAGLSVTGNELSPNDERIGIPRLLQMRDVLTRTSLEEAAAAVEHPARASSYNWVLASPEGALNVEGSATAAVATALGAEAPLVHTNHYVEPSMAVFEADPEYAERSAVRYRRCRQLVAGAGDPITSEVLRELLSDHEGAPDSVCRHGDAPDAVKTVFWCVADVTERAIRYGRGNPCDSEEQIYRFDSTV